jgi:hypothetical protein
MAEELPALLRRRLQAEWLEREGGRTVFIRHVGYSVGSDCLFRRYTGPYKTVIRTHSTN